MRFSTPIRCDGIVACSMWAAATARSSSRRPRASQPAPDAVRPAPGRRARQRSASPLPGSSSARRGRAAISSPIRCRPGPTSSRWFVSCTTTTTRGCIRILRAVRARAAGRRHAPGGRADVGHAGRRTHGRRVFRLLPAGDGPRPRRGRLRSSTPCCARPASVDPAGRDRACPLQTGLMVARP